MNARARTVPFIDLPAQYARLKTAIDQRIAGVLTHGAFVNGPEVAELEQALAMRAEARHAIGVASGTDALQIALMAEQIGPGDGVFVPAFTYVATASAVRLVGATPIFVDVLPDSFNIDSASLKAALVAETDLRPRAVIAVDLYGHPADYAALRPIADEAGLTLIADAAQSFGARADNRAVGALAPVTTTSFFPTKTLGAYGDGGAIFTDDDARAARYRAIRLHGFGATRGVVEHVGMTGRIDTLQAAVLLAKLTAFDDELARREAIAAHYDRDLPARLRRPPRGAGIAPAWALYTVEVAERAGTIAALAEAGIGTGVYYDRALHRQPVFRDGAAQPVPLPVAEHLADRVLSLPLHADLSDADLDHVIGCVTGLIETA